MGCDSSNPKPVAQFNTQAIKISWCCSRGRLFILWLTLCFFDNEWSKTKQIEAAKTSSGSRSGVRGSGTGYEAEDLFGRGMMFGGGNRLHQAQRNAGTTQSVRKPSVQSPCQVATLL
jgi:baculoviral IAP repeat-containing protein 6